MSLKIIIDVAPGNVLSRCTIEVPPEAVGVTWGQAAAYTNHQRLKTFTELVTGAVLEVVKTHKSDSNPDDDSSGIFTPSTNATTRPSIFSLSNDSIINSAEGTATITTSEESHLPKTLDLSLGLLPGATIDFKVVYKGAITHCRLRKSATLETLFKSLAQGLKLEVTHLRLTFNNKVCFPSDTTVSTGISSDATVALSTN